MALSTSMHLEEVPVTTDPLPDVIVTAKPKTREETRTRQVPPYNVILENDDHHSFEFVIGVLQKAIGFSPERGKYQR